jgi:hypothetical protein
MKLTIGRKLGFGFGIVLTPMLVSAVFTYVKLNAMRERQDRAFSETREIAGISAYSALNACIGSRRDARHAGTIHANAAAASSVAATAAKTAGSSGLIS